MSELGKNGCYKDYQHMPHAAFIGWCTGITDPEIKEAPCDLAINKVLHDSHVLTSSDRYIYKCYGYHKLPFDEPKFQDYKCGLKLTHGPHISEQPIESGVKLRCFGNLFDFWGSMPEEIISPVSEWLEDEINRQAKAQFDAERNQASR